MTSYYAPMPTVAVYVSAADARSLEAEGKKVDEWVRAVVKAGLSERDEGPAGMTTTQPEEAGRISRDDEGPKAQPLVPRSESPAAKRTYEAFSLVCPNRANHEPGVYCPECKGDGGR